ncbi:MAG: HIT domain-containing protein, partial [Dehalococcoidales bacterium]|nr:HIT domain-containing protein [Dehalococcoidales bacterium]
MNKDKDCIFCKIVSGEVPTELLYQDKDVIVFHDINPITPVHLLVVTRKHIPSLADMADAEMPLVGKM